MQDIGDGNPPQPGDPAPEEPRDDRDMSKRIESLTESVGDLRTELAAQRPVAELIRYLVYFWAAISLVLGFLGWTQLSDLDNVVEQKVKLQFPKSSAQYTDYEKLISETSALYSRFEDLTAQYKERVDDLKRAEQMTALFDIEGQVMALLLDAERRQNAQKHEQTDGGDAPSETLLDPSWRRKAILIVTAFQKSLGEKNYPADFIFNVAQLCRMLQQFELAEKLTKAAHSQDSSPPIRAMYLASRVQTSTGEEREQAFTDLLEMVTDLSDDSPHIVLAEAWNASESQRRYTELVTALDKLIQDRSAENAPRPVPSYAYVIKAQAVLRRSYPGCIGEAEACLESVDRLLRQESTMSQWADSAMREGVEVRTTLITSRELSLPTIAEVESRISESLGLPPTGFVPGDLASDLMEALGIAKAERVTTASGELIEAGTKIRVEKPVDTEEGSGWTDEMDLLASQEMTVEEIVTFGDITFVTVSENDESWDIRWITLVRRDRN